MKSQGRQLHAQAAQARESGDFENALQLSDQAMLAYQQAGDKLGLSELLTDRSITFRHLFEKTGDKDFLLITKAEMEASVEIARRSNNKEALALPIFNLAKVEESLKNYSTAINHYKEAIEQVYATPGINEPNPNSPAHNRPATIPDMKVHLSYSEYKNGDKSALERMEQSLQDLANSPEVDSYAKNTWLSGGYISMAEMLKEDNPEKANEALQKAKEIINSDERLTLRKQQWEKLAQSFS